MARALPEAAVLPASRAVGAALAPLVPRRRAVIARHLRRAHGGELSDRAVRDAVKEAFGSYARYWMESFRLPSMTPAELDAAFTAEGVELLEGARAHGHGAILALPHLGGWERAGAWLVLHGFPLTVVVEPLEPPELFEWFVALRRSFGFRVVPLGPHAGTAVLRSLRANEVVALLCDRDVGGEGIEVEFFGERTTLPAGPATLALRSGAALLPTAVYFEGPGAHAVVRPPVPLERTGRFRDDAARVTQALASELEILVRRAPEQWHLFQPNWPSDRVEVG